MWKNEMINLYIADQLRKYILCLLIICLYFKDHHAFYIILQYCTDIVSHC